MNINIVIKNGIVMQDHINFRISEGESAIRFILYPDKKFLERSKEKCIHSFQNLVLEATIYSLVPHVTSRG